MEEAGSYTLKIFRKEYRCAPYNRVGSHIDSESWDCSTPLAEITASRTNSKKSKLDDEQSLKKRVIIESLVKISTPRR